MEYRDLFGHVDWEVNDSDFEGFVPDSNNYEDKINQIEIPHERAKARNEALTEAKQSTFAIGIMKIDAGCANCATGRDLRRIGRRAKFYSWRTGRFAR